MLFLDGVLLVLAGAWTARAGLIVLGVVLLAGGVGVIWMWRRWRVTLASIDEARQRLHHERDALSTLFHRSQSDG